jgi:hypothetical protein
MKARKERNRAKKAEKVLDKSQAIPEKASKVTLLRALFKIRVPSLRAESRFSSSKIVLSWAENRSRPV